MAEEKLVNPLNLKADLERGFTDIASTTGLPLSEELEKTAVNSTASTELEDEKADPEEVIWAEKDPELPLNWSKRRKWSTMMVRNFYLFLAFIKFDEIIRLWPALPSSPPLLPPS